MFSHRTAIAAAVAITMSALLTACGGESTTTTTVTNTQTVTVTTTVTTPTTTPTTPALEQPAIWPAAGVRFATPKQAAADFVSKVLKVPVTLGPFQAGDSRSGEIELRFAGESGNGPRIVRSVLLMRQLGPDSSWFVLAAVNKNASITKPASGATVPAGPLKVSGRGRGFEGALNVSAFVAGTPRRIDTKLAQGGSMETPEPFTVTLNLSQARSGDTVVLLVRGGVGLETDPGEVGAIPVVIK